MNKTESKRFHFSFTAHWAWIFYIITFCLVYCYISKDSYRIAILTGSESQYTMWHDLYYQLDNGMMMPFQHWIGLFLLFFQYMNIQTMPDSLLRYSRKSYWYWKTFREMFCICLKVVTLGYVLMFSLSAIRCGLPHSMTFGEDAPTNQPIPVMFVTDFLCRLNISFFGAVLYLFVMIWRNNGVFSYLFCIIYFLVSHIILRLTPPYMSFKHVGFASCYTYHYISDGLYLENVQKAFGLPLLFGIMAVFFSIKLLKRFPERGSQQ